MDEMMLMGATWDPRALRPTEPCETNETRREIPNLDPLTISFACETAPGSHSKEFVIGYECTSFPFESFFRCFLPGVREFNQSPDAATHFHSQCMAGHPPLDPHAGYWLTPMFERMPW